MGEKGLIPLFSEACLFRQQNLWRGNTNYGVSGLLVDRLALVEGLDSLEATGPYEITFAISRLFEEQAVKTTLSGAFRTFVKEMLAKRTPPEEITKTSVLGITMPNGNKIYIDPTTPNATKQGEILEEIAIRIKNAELIQ